MYLVNCLSQTKTNPYMFLMNYLNKIEPNLYIQPEPDQNRGAFNIVAARLSYVDNSY